MKKIVIINTILITCLILLIAAFAILTKLNILWEELKFSTAWLPSADYSRVEALYDHFKAVIAAQVFIGITALINLAALLIVDINFFSNLRKNKNNPNSNS
jgi:putative exporter of polyketide antibiotics